MNDHRAKTKGRRVFRGVLRLLCLGSILAFFLWAILEGYGLKWTGFGSSTLDSRSVPSKTLWDWLDLVLVPLFLALGAWFLESSRKKSEEHTEADRQRQATLDSYFASMSKLLLENRLDNSKENESARAVARTSTLAALRSLDGGRKARLLQFLYEAGLIEKDPVIQLNGADLKGADLECAVLRGAELRGIYFNGATLRNAVLCQGMFCGSDFSKADLVGADFDGADLSQAIFKGSSLTSDQLASAAEVADVLVDIELVGRN